jgi:protein-S-isoprenylcysteine O-methyltransferase Ste14
LPCLGYEKSASTWKKLSNGAVKAVIEFNRWFLALFFSAVAIFYTARILILTRRFRMSPVYFGQLGTLHFATHAAFRFFRVAILLICIARVFWPSFDRYLIPLASLWHPYVLALGDCLLLAGITIVLYVHFYMGDAWRSGTNSKEKARLITTGPFSMSRNPMMLAVILAQFGLFLALPSVFTLICLVVGVWAVSLQVGIEERILEQRFGQTYHEYAARTPRWLHPWKS